MPPLSRTVKSLSRAAAIVVAFGCGYQPHAESQRNVEVRFGILDAGDGDFIETALVPNVEGQLYGWIATITPAADPIPWSEELTLPRAPRDWIGTDGDPSVSISDDRRIALTRGIVAPNSAEFSHFWGVSAGDPPGTYTLVVKVSDGVVAEVDFEFVDSRR